ncbi:hypothetical protein BDV33DRAFT_137647 [Aspergillus novoparasiticus]|uniref:Uncharacterized protein n=1 Tax=Aspergillus novoparasiticus TaxID=986946 RepID=A0A5N6E5R3_9EURO|nr:hypothetical protein BDV33DRAFT_137647 [Aspergillus novoparasiticus]
MASLAKNRYYNWYKIQVEAGSLELPAYEEDANGIILYYGELFCRFEDCDKATKKFSSTNNLRTHLEKHESLEVPSGGEGGRVGQKEIDKAVAWYKSLFAEDVSVMSLSPSPGPAGSPPPPAAPPVAPPRPPPVAPVVRPSLPLKKDGTPHLLNMRRRAEDLGGSVPCRSCESKSDCCRDINKCDNFLLFDCGALAPTPAPKVPKMPKTA